MADPGRWPSYRYLAGAAVVLGLLWGALRLLAAAIQPLLLVVIAILLAFLLHYPIDFFSRRLPRSLATLLTLLILLGGCAWLARWLLPQLHHQAADLIGRIPALVDAAARWWERMQLRRPLAALPGEEIPAQLERRLLDEIGALLSNALPIALDLLTAVIASVFVLAVAFFLAFRPSLYVQGLLRVVPPAQEARFASFVDRVGGVIRGWLAGALVAMTTVGLLTALATRLLGLETWLLLGFLAFALELIPYAGPILAAVPAVAIALTESPALAAYTALAYLAIQQVEGNVITPIVMKRAIELPPALLLLWQVVLVGAFGVLALFVAAPLLAVALVAVDHFWVKGALGREEKGA